MERSERSDKGVSRPHYDNSRRAAMAQHRELSKLAALMVEQIDQLDYVHPDSLAEAMKWINKAVQSMDDSKRFLERAETVLNEEPKVRNQRERRRKGML